MCSPAPTDAELLFAHRAGDRHAFAELAARYRSRLWGLALRTLRDPEDAADAVQETLVAAFRRAGSYRGDASVRTWLHRILVNSCIDRIRHERRHTTVPLPDRDLAAGQPDIASELVTRLTVDAALAALPVEQRLAVVLVDVQGWPVMEAAELLEVPVGTVKSRCARGRARLAVLLGHLREEER
ncbi:RNA polymerase sigma factor SigM [Pseudonocardia xinjiangensis]|uniref:RNA polymerase sigma factor SigM n=1 Tax=Pseudonocardia xinjiangensis TaxID=75289 RepID=A0ABX1RSC5_9PSEU|nr:RNA polymerase sigma factor SigM [Pseudonocardia xinjiangensis]NMH82076.1 RNA polymerase sigma factor SigM [Pseudonocardia xinjiangensis]